MTYDELIDGLKQRGFQYTEDICNKGGCHLDERHFILLTDGLVIYSNFWDWNCCGYEKDYGNVKNGLYEIWSLENPEDSWMIPNSRIFSFKELDEIIKI